MKETLQDFIRNHPEEYADWQKNPVTARLREISRDMARPVRPNPADPPHRDSYSLGEHVGYLALWDIVFNADAMVELQKQAAEVARRLQPTYGAGKT